MGLPFPLAIGSGRATHVAFLGTEDVLVTGVVLVAGVVLVLIGSVPIVRGARLRWGDRQDVEAVSDGYVGIEGTAAPTDEHGTLPSPLSGEETLLYDYEIQEYVEQGDDHAWETIVGDSDGVPFVLDDGTGEITVNPAGSTLLLGAKTSKHVDLREVTTGNGSATPAPGNGRAAADGRGATADVSAEELDDLVTRHDTRTGRVHVGSVALNEGSRYRLRERRIEPAEHLSVTGTADSEWDGEGSLVYATDEDAGLFGSLIDYPFVVADYAETASGRYLFKRGAAWAGVGLIAFLLALSLDAFIPVALAGGVVLGAVTRSPGWCWVLTIGILLFGETGIENTADPLFLGPVVAAVAISLLVSVYRIWSDEKPASVDTDRWNPTA